MCPGSALGPGGGLTRRPNYVDYLDWLDAEEERLYVEPLWMSELLTISHPVGGGWFAHRCRDTDGVVNRELRPHLSISRFRTGP